MTFQEKAKPQGWKVDQWMPVVMGERGGVDYKGTAQGHLGAVEMFCMVL